ncbi:SDR family oxidoreductase [Ruegeria sp. Ofav3-42]|uniref:SDR family oxidoreductase n=1 Tax=Ruegeria sp. Ofav3-42 TaxID=2917759 RepID=UPI001EF3E35B|nr:SDR family oxidoreductase [Ruegeria sp. Ofav3-42]MCG7522640.1 SDR family oxidoreductase [Ruegeria sp. Ofav3-42]
MSNGGVLILGARSDIALAVAHSYAALGHPIQLAARNVQTLQTEKEDLEIRYQVNVSLHNFDVLDLERHADVIEGLPELPEIAVCAVGVLGNQESDEKDILAAAQIMRANFEGPASILAVLANRFEQRGSGVLVGISSVAGERGRATNYIYGSAKAGFTTYLSGLRNRLAKQGVHVVTVLPGFVDTRMTEGLDLPPKLTAQPSEVAAAIVRATRRQKNTVYVKPLWAFILTAIRLIPESLFKKMNI